MTEAKPGSLAEALNRLQAELKPIRRNTEGQVGQRKRKYADRAAVTEVVYPLLGKHGLSFSAKPTLKDGQFVLAYKLRHVSGEEDAGDWPLHGGKPQDVGSEITYALRYCLQAMTGAAPEGEDDDGQAAQQGDPWQDARPAPERFAHTDAAHERLVESAVDRAVHKPAQRIKGRAPEDEWNVQVVTDQEWLAKIEPEIKSFGDDDQGEVLRRRVTEKVDAGGCSRDEGNRLRTLIRARRQALVVEGEKVAADAG